MSMLVEGVDPPKSCYDCPFNAGEYEPAYYEKRYCSLIKGFDMKPSYYKKRPKECPIKEVTTCES